MFIAVALFQLLIGPGAPAGDQPWRVPGEDLGIPSRLTLHELQNEFTLGTTHPLSAAPAAWGEERTSPSEPLRTEEWDSDFFAGLRLVEWAMFQARQKVRSGTNEWDISIEDAIGLDLFVGARVHGFWFEKHFEYATAVLSTTDRLILRSLGGRLGWDFLNEGYERSALYVGLLFNTSKLRMEENDTEIPGDLKRSVGWEGGFRYSRQIAGGGERSATLWITADAALRYLAFKFDGDSPVGDERFGGLGLVLTFGAAIRY